MPNKEPTTKPTKPAATRIYLVRNEDTGEERLIRAANSVQARNHAARDTLTVTVAKQEQLVALLTRDDAPAIEDAGSEAVESGAE